MAHRKKKNSLFESVLKSPSWVFLLLAVSFYIYLSTKGGIDQAIALPVSLVFLLASLSKLFTEVKLAGVERPTQAIQARLFQGKSDKKKTIGFGGNKASQSNGQDNDNNQTEEDVLQDQYQEALNNLQRKRDEEAAAVLEKIGSTTLETAESEHILRPESKESNKNSSSVTMDLNVLKALSDEKFEATIAAYYHCKGYHAEVSKVAGGVELLLRKKEMSKSSSIVTPTCIVHIRSGKTGNTESRFVRILHDRKFEERVKSALMISRSTFTKGAVEFAEGYKLLLLDPRRLAKVINELPEEQIEKILAIALK